MKYVSKELLKKIVCSIPNLPVEYEIELLKHRDSELAFYYVLSNYTNGSFIMTEWENIVLDNKELYWNYMFASIPGADVLAHGKVIIDSGDPKFNFLFLSKEGADKEAHIREIIKSKDLLYNYSCIRDYDWVNVKDHFLAMIGDSSESKMKFVNFFDDDYKMEVWNIVEPLILELKDLEFSYLVARDVKWADVKAHEGIVFESGNLEWIYKFARDVEKADRKRLAFPIIISKSPELNYLYARDVPNINIFPHEKVVLDSRSQEWNIEFAINVAGANIQAHKRALSDSYINVAEIIDQRLKEFKRTTSRKYSKKCYGRPYYFLS